MKKKKKKLQAKNTTHKFPKPKMKCEETQKTAGNKQNVYKIRFFILTGSCWFFGTFESLFLTGDQVFNATYKKENGDYLTRKNFSSNGYFSF